MRNSSDNSIGFHRIPTTRRSWFIVSLLLLLNLIGTTNFAAPPTYLPEVDASDVSSLEEIARTERASVLEIAPPDQAIVGTLQRHSFHSNAVQPQLMVRLSESEIQTLSRIAPTAIDPHVVPSSGSPPLRSLGMLLRL